MKKLVALFIVIVVLSSIPLVAASNSKPPISKAVFVHRADGYVKPEGVGKPKPVPDEPQLFDLMGKNIKWKSLDLRVVINPTNNDGLSEDFVVSSVIDAAEKWDEASSSNLFTTYEISYDAAVDTYDQTVLYNEDPDGDNEVVFGDIPEPGAIAVCIVWYINVGAPSQRGIVEFDIIFDDADFNWGYAGETNENAVGDVSVMDLQNIATHELGHSLGLADLYFSEASEQTMFGIGAYGETKKRTLNEGDVEGIKTLYG
jgi:hypothetical protein